MKYLILSLLWSGYCALHSFLISTSFTNFLQRSLKKYFAFYRLFYVIVSFVLLIPLLNYQTDSEVIIVYSAPLEFIRQLLMYGSLVMFFWAFFIDYDALSFFGIRQIMYFFSRKDKISSGTIKKGGLLGLIRHPLYLALIIFLWSSIFTLGDLVINSLLTLYVVIGTVLEERKLILEFGDAYIQYQQEVPMLIPFTKKKIISARHV